MRALIKTAPGVGHLEFSRPRRRCPDQARRSCASARRACAAPICCSTTACIADAIGPCLAADRRTRSVGRSRRAGTGHGRAGAGHARRHRGRDRMRSLLSLPARPLQPVPGLASHRTDARRCAGGVRGRAGDLAAAAARRGHARERGVSRTARDRRAHAGTREARARDERPRSSARGRSDSCTCRCCRPPVSARS